MILLKWSGVQWLMVWCGVVVSGDGGGHFRPADVLSTIIFFMLLSAAALKRYIDCDMTS